MMAKDNTKIAVSVGAGILQYDFIDKLKKRGYKVAGFGHGKNAQKTIERCDYFEDIDTADADSAIQWLKSLKRPISAIGSCAGGVAIRTLQIIANYYDLPTAIPEELIVGMNKLDQQLLYDRYNLSNIKTYSCLDLKQNIDNIVVDKEYIIKPSIGRGSAGVEKCKGKEVLRRLYANELDDNDILQTIVQGKEYRMLMMVQNGKIKLLAPILRTSYKQTFFLGRLEVSFRDFEKILEHAQRMVKNLEILNTIIKYDIIINEEDVNVIEMDIGVGGGFYFKKYISTVMDTDIMDMYIDLICNSDITEIVCKNEGLVMDYIYNENSYPVQFDIDECKKQIMQRFGSVIILQNQQHPEKKGYYHSNADFLFTVIHANKNISVEEMNQFVNEKLLMKGKDNKDYNE